jgi:hypothetical protein
MRYPRARRRLEVVMEGDTKLYFDALVAFSMGNTAAITQIAGALAEKGLLTPADVERVSAAFMAPLDGLPDDAPDAAYFRQLRGIMAKFLTPMLDEIHAIARERHPDDTDD